MEKIISDKDKEISDYKEKIELLQKDNKDNKINEKIKIIKKKSNNFKNEDNKSCNNTLDKNSRKYLDEISELKNNIKKLENDKTNLKSKIDYIENKKNSNNNLQKQIDDLKKQITYSNNQMKSLKTKSSEFDEFFVITRTFIKMIKPSNDKEKDLYFKLKNQIEYLEKEKISK